jgi:hypothetical protein
VERREDNQRGKESGMNKQVIILDNAVQHERVVRKLQKLQKVIGSECVEEDSYSRIMTEIKRERGRVRIECV